MRRLAISLLVTGIGVAFSSVVCAQGSPNVVLFLVDDLGYADSTVFGANPGFYETRNMERLAQQGVTFFDAYASPVCSPTRSAIMTGKNPARTHHTNFFCGGGQTTALRPPGWDCTLDSSEVTLAEALGDGGYNTGHIGKWHLGTSGTTAADPLQNGFDVNIGGNHRGQPNGSTGNYFANASGSFGLPELGNGSATPGDYLTDILTDRAVDYIFANANGLNPFFMELNHYGVHNPLQAPTNLVTKYQTKGSTIPGQTNATYAAMIETVDTSLGRILDALEDPNGDGNMNDSIANNTVVIFYSDNGGLVNNTRNTPYDAGKGGIAEGGIRVPLIVSWAGNSDVTQNTQSNALVTQEDLYTTILDFAGVSGDASHNAQTDGISFRSALEGDITGDRDAVFIHFPHFHGSGVRYNSFDTAMRQGKWKLIYQYETEDWDLFDLSVDPGESNDLADTELAVLSQMTGDMRQWLIDVGAQMPIDRSTGLPVSLPEAVIIPEPHSLSLMGVGAFSLLMTLIGRFRRRCLAQARIRN